MPIQIQGRASQIETRSQDGTTYVPVLETVQALGGKAEWDNASKVATVSIATWNARVAMAAEEADVNGIHVNFNGPTFVEENRLWVPVRFFEKAFGYKIDLNG